MNASTVLCTNDIFSRETEYGLNLHVQHKRNFAKFSKFSVYVAPVFIKMMALFLCFSGETNRKRPKLLVCEVHFQISGTKYMGFCVCGVLFTKIDVCILPLV